MSITRAQQILDIEARAIDHLRETLASTNFNKVIEQIVHAHGRVILTGIGKSGIICRKIAATLASTGTPAFFLHPAEAIHGDLGMVVRGDTVIAISNSGETQELIQLLEHLKRNGASLIAITSKEASTLACFADIALIFRIEEEGCPLGLAPMASTTVTLALGDAIAGALMDAKGFTSHQFAQYHPGGKLGKKLLTVADVIKDHPKPIISATAKLSEALIEMSEKRLGMTVVSLDEGTIGVLSDGDIRRLLQTHGHDVLDMEAGSLCTPNPKTISQKKLAVEALNQMENNKITALVVNDEHGKYAGVVHLHDLWKIIS